MRLLLVGAEPPFSDWISQSLSNRGFVVDVAHSIQMPQAGTHSTIIVDLESNYSHEAAQLRRLRQLYGAMPILALTGSDADARVRSLQGGADDCLAKPVTILELVECLRRLLRHPPSPSDHVLRIKGLELYSSSREIEVKGKHHVLRYREATILEILMTWPNRLVSKQRLEIDLYGKSTKNTSNAIEVGIHRLRKNLTDAGADVTIETARNAGYILKEGKRN